MILRRALIWIICGILLLTIGRKIAVYIIGAVLLWFAIRIGADIYWWYHDTRR